MTEPNTIALANMKDLVLLGNWISSIRGPLSPAFKTAVRAKVSKLFQSNPESWNRLVAEDGDTHKRALKKIGAAFDLPASTSSGARAVATMVPELLAAITSEVEDDTTPDLETATNIVEALFASAKEQVVDLQSRGIPCPPLPDRPVVTESNRFQSIRDMEHLLDRLQTASMPAPPARPIPPVLPESLLSGPNDPRSFRPSWPSGPTPIPPPGFRVTTTLRGAAEASPSLPRNLGHHPHLGRGSTATFGEDSKELTGLDFVDYATGYGSRSLLQWYREQRLDAYQRPKNKSIYIARQLLLSVRTVDVLLMDSVLMGAIRSNSGSPVLFLEMLCRNVMVYYLLLTQRTSWN